MQNNSRNKASKRGGYGAGSKNSRTISKLFDEFRDQRAHGDATGMSENLILARVERKLGNGRLEIRYAVQTKDTIVDRDGTVLEDKQGYIIETGQAVIRGSFRGKAKRAVWIEVNSVVLVEDSGLGIKEVVGVLSRDQLKDVAKEIFVHPQILSDQKDRVDEGEAIEFDRSSLSDTEIDNI